VALLILAAVSGTGKSTIARRLLARRPNLRVSVSHTTRAPREGETDGVDYHFVSRETFEDMVAAGAFAEWAEYVGNLYGTARATIDGAKAAGLDLLFDIEVQGARQLKAVYPSSIGCFLLPPSWAVLRDRLERRGTDSKEVVDRRLQRGRVELEEAEKFDHRVVNDVLEEAVTEVERLLVGATSGRSLRSGVLHRLIAQADADSTLES
jgi:guanylate kinase